MVYDARAIRMGVFVVVAGGGNDIPATRAIVQHREVSLDKVRNAASFRPILEVALDSYEPIDGLVAVAVFEYLHDGDMFEWRLQPQQAERRMTFFPHILPNLAPFRGDGMAGTWEVRAKLALIRESMLSSPERIAILHGLNYQQIASITWRVTVPARRVRLNSVGELTDPIDLMGDRERVTLTLDDI